jgi:PIN domain nuclease of toxin-antitoxin system
LGDDPALGVKAREVIAGASTTALVSGASAMEIMIKYRKGRLPQAEALAHDFTTVLGQLQCLALDVSFEHAVLAGSLDSPHKDPFDRLLIAQARIERVPLVSNEALFDAFGVERIW